VLRKISGSAIEEVTGDWRKLCNEEHHGFSILIRYNSSEQIKGSEMSGACGMYGGKRSAFRVLVENQKGRLY